MPACSVPQLCLTLLQPHRLKYTGSSVHEIFQARILEWVAISTLSGSSDPGIKPAFAALAGGLFTTEPPGKLPLFEGVYVPSNKSKYSVTVECSCMKPMII